MSYGANQETETLIGVNLRHVPGPEADSQTFPSVPSFSSIEFPLPCPIQCSENPLTAFSSYTVA